MLDVLPFFSQNLTSVAATRCEVALAGWKIYSGDVKERADMGIKSESLGVWDTHRMDSATSELDEDNHTLQHIARAWNVQHTLAPETDGSSTKRCIRIGTSSTSS